MSLLLRTPKRITGVYKIGSGQRMFLFVLAAFASVLLASFFWKVLRGERDPDVWTLLVAFAFVIIGGAVIAEKLTTSLTVTENEVRLRKLFVEDRLPTEKIRGRRRYFDPGDGEVAGEWRLKIVSGDDRFPTLDFEENYDFDDAFRAWFNGLPDLDKADKTAPKPSNFGLV